MYFVLIFGNLLSLVSSFFCFIHLPLNELQFLAVLNVMSMIHWLFILYFKQFVTCLLSRCVISCSAFLQSSSVSHPSIFALLSLCTDVCASECVFLSHCFSCAFCGIFPSSFSVSIFFFNLLDVVPLYVDVSCGVFYLVFLEVEAHLLYF